MLNYKKNRKEISSLHSKLRNKHGSATKCSNKECSKKSFIYEWALITGREYTDNPDDYIQLCRSCHRRYDLTENKRKKAIKNLMWSNGKSKTKLTEKIVFEIRDRIKNGEIMFRLAKEFGVHKTNIKQIKDNKIWKEPMI